MGGAVHVGIIGMWVCHVQVTSSVYGYTNVYVQVHVYRICTGLCRCA